LISEYYHIAISPDDNYANHGLTMLNSLVINNPSAKFYVHILDGGINLKTKIKYRIFFHKRKIKYKFYKKDLNKIQNAPISNHITISAYNRIFLSSILDTSIDRILYLDCDLIIKKTIIDLLEIDLDSVYLGAIEEKTSNDVINNLSLEKSKYFNSGVLILNLKKWRDDRLEDKMIDFIVNNGDKIIYHDQDTLNFACKNNWKFISHKYNVTHFFYYPDKFGNEYFGLTNEEYLAIKSDPVILHFTGIKKPWKKECEHPMKEEYFKYELTFKKLIFS
jgi:lipopolysaccharide biosynthesis glycosyltransferase